MNEYRCQYGSEEPCTNIPKKYVSKVTGNYWYMCDEHIEELRELIGLEEEK